jgi:hypothetical protein
MGQRAAEAGCTLAEIQGYATHRNDS